ncbi:MAG: aminomethyl-transferring glycine dehydrogenase subunit GcvPA [Firmicutes bacterium]|nr:aminomethyl-transferring glycine dehydrogenase subunit GcvPA [Bacillota bacterium]
MTKRTYPYMPGSVPAAKQALLRELGIDSVEVLLKDIPDDLRFPGKMKLPPPLLEEYELKRHVQAVLAGNANCQEYISFLGAGCYQHYVPAVCDEVNSRAEFLTAYCGETYSDHGKMQAIFEYCSLMAELLDLDVVSYTLYDGGQAAASALRMATRITGGTRVLVPATMHPEVLSQLQDYCRPVAQVVPVQTDADSGRLNLEDLQAKLTPGTAAVFVENPTYLGAIETDVREIATLVHSQQALFVVSADPSSLGLLESPANYGADIVVGDIQPLGMHMQYGGGCGGFIATRDEPEFINQYPTYLYGITTTQREGEYGWARALNYRTSHEGREKANEYFGTESGLWAITAAVYLSLMGPQGLRELGETIVYRSNYARQVFSALPGVEARFTGPIFKEFVLNFDACGRSVASINKALLEYGIFGGKDLSQDFPHLGQSALFCVTEVITQADIQRLACALQEILAGERGNGND